MQNTNRKENMKKIEEMEKHNKLKWLLKDELNMLTTDELYKIKKLIISFYDKEH